MRQNNCYEIILCDKHKDTDDPWTTAANCDDCQHVEVEWADW